MRIVEEADSTPQLTGDAIDICGSDHDLMENMRTAFMTEREIPALLHIVRLLV